MLGLGIDFRQMSTMVSCNCVLYTKLVSCFVYKDQNVYVQSIVKLCVIVSNVIPFNVPCFKVIRKFIYKNFVIRRTLRKMVWLISLVDAVELLQNISSKLSPST